MAHQKKLWDASQDGDIEKIAMAINCGANVNMPDEERVPPSAGHGTLSLPAVWGNLSAYGGQQRARGGVQAAARERGLPD